MSGQGHVLGIDFGTSNSGAAYLRNGQPHFVDVGNGQKTLPTTFFFDFDTRQTLIGEPANRALLNGDDGRFMRALKRVLGTSLMHQKRQVLNETLTFVEIIAKFLRHLKTQAEMEAGVRFDAVLSGRPVVFHGQDDPREAQAEADLRACYLAAGFERVSFMAEPQAAAIASGVPSSKTEIGLIVDIGGGTSDFSLFQAGADGVDILANYGIRIGGTDFDRAINTDRVMPLLGRGTVLRKVFGSETSPVPTAIFNDLATWEKIPFLYTGQIRRMVQEMVRLAVEPDKLNRLATVLENELGHDLAFAVERGKIAANSGDVQAAIMLDQIERGLSVPLPPDPLRLVLNKYANDLASAAHQTLQVAGIKPSQIARVVYVGGSSLMAMVPETMQSQFPQAEHSFDEVFTAVTRGLAIASREY